MIRLIASDMDGTLLDENSQVPEGTFELIHDLWTEGVRFVVSSGRPYQFLYELFRPVAHEMDFVCSNGCHVVIEGVTTDRELFSYEALMRLRDLCEGFDSLHVTVHDEHDQPFLLDSPAKALRFRRTVGRQWNFYPTPAVPPPTTNILTASVACDSDESIMDIAYLLNLEMGRDFTFAPTDGQSIDFMPAHVNKATGIEQVLEHYDVYPEEAIAYGDSRHDYDIFRIVGHPTAMANALYAPKQVATRIIESNLERGVQRDMKRLLEEMRAGGDGSKTLRFGAKS